MIVMRFKKETAFSPSKGRFLNKQTKNNYNKILINLTLQSLSEGESQGEA